MSSELKATPGPYHLGEAKSGRSYIYARNSEQPMKPEVRLGKTNVTDEMRANAHLLAASWELYQALEALVEPTYLEPLSVMVNRGKAALAKARGEQ